MRSENAARWRELGNSAETRIFIIPTPINNNNTNVVIGLSFRLSSPTIPKGRQAASWAKHLAQCSAADLREDLRELNAGRTRPATNDDEEADIQRRQLDLTSLTHFYMRDLGDRGLRPLSLIHI